MEQTQLTDNNLWQKLKTVQTSDLPKHRAFLWRRKITKCERHTKETLINNSFIKERVFYHLNEWFVSNRTGDIIFLTRIFRTLQTMNPTFHSDLPTCANTQNFSCCRNFDKQFFFEGMSILLLEWPTCVSQNHRYHFLMRKWETNEVNQTSRAKTQKNFTAEKLTNWERHTTET